MIDYLNGIIADKHSSNKGNFLIVEIGGIGYRIELCSRDYSTITDIGQPVKVYTVLNHKEDSMTLCGFLKKEARDIFRILTSVSGVGSKMGLTLLSEFDVADLTTFVINGRYQDLTRAKGVGQKLAQKIILELKDKLIPISNDNFSTVSDSYICEDAQCVLYSLGYGQDEVKDAMQKALVTISDKNNEEEVLRETLKILSM